MDTETLEVDFIRESLSLLVDHVAVQAAIVVAIAFVVARLVDVVIARVILRLARKTSTTLDDRLVELVHRPLFMTVVLLGLLIALHIVAPNELAATIGGVLVQTLVIVLWTSFGIRASRLLSVRSRMTRRACASSNPRRDPCSKPRPPWGSSRSAPT